MILRLGSCVLSALVAAASSIACVAIDPDAQLCAVGQAECACTLGGACDPGLACVAGTCVDPDPTGNSSVAGTEPAESDDSDTMPPVESSSDDGVDDTGDSTGDTSPTTSANYAFVTSTAYTGGGLGGLAGADAICQGHADAAGLAGTYRAWLSTTAENARDRFGDARGWIRPDGSPLAVDVAQIVDGRFFHPPALDENGTFSAPNAVWTGTVADGTANSIDGFDICGGWTNEDAGAVALAGDLGAGPSWWTAFSTPTCNSTARLMCFGVDQQHDLVVEPVIGRLAFVSAGHVSPTQGRAAADALCQAEGEAAGDDGTFLALLAVPGEAPAARFDLAGEPWVRADGIPIFREGDVMGDTLATPFVFDAMGNTSNLAIGWAGSYGAQAPGEAVSSCTGWTATTGNAAMFAIIHIFWQAWAIGGGEPECAQPGYSVICLEE